MPYSAHQKRYAMEQITKEDANSATMEDFTPETGLWAFKIRLGQELKSNGH